MISRVEADEAFRRAVDAGLARPSKATRVADAEAEVVALGGRVLYRRAFNHVGIAQRADGSLVAIDSAPLINEKGTGTAVFTVELGGTE